MNRLQRIDAPIGAAAAIPDGKQESGCGVLLPVVDGAQGENGDGARDEGQCNSGRGSRMAVGIRKAFVGISRLLFRFRLCGSGLSL